MHKDMNGGGTVTLQVLPLHSPWQIVDLDQDCIAHAVHYHSSVMQQEEKNVAVSTLWQGILPSTE